MKALATLIVFAFCGSPVVAVVVAVMRADEGTVNAAVVLVATGLFLLLAGGAAAFVIYALAEVRAAQHPRPSHSYDQREQHIDMRRQTVLVDAHGNRIPLPEGAKLMEVDR